MRHDINTPPPGFRLHPTWPGLAASEDGRVMRWNLRFRPHQWGHVRPRVGSSWYLTFCRPFGGWGTVYAHRVVYECFHGVGHKWSNKSGSGMVINHINGIKTDNRLVNLEAITNYENMRLTTCARTPERTVPA